MGLHGPVRRIERRQKRGGDATDVSTGDARWGPDSGNRQMQLNGVVSHSRIARKKPDLMDAAARPSLRVESHRSGATKERRGQAAELVAVLAVDLASIAIEPQPLANAHTPVGILAML